MQLHRRSFLGAVGVGPLAVSMAAPAAAAASAAASDKWDMSWTARVDRKYRAVFDSPGFSDGAALIRAVNWKDEHRLVYGTAPQDMSAVLVVRAEGVWLAMNDAFWKTYDVGQANHFKDEKTGKFLAANPLGSPDAEKGLPQFLAAGNVVLACHRAFGAVVAHVRKVDHLATDEQAEEKAMTFVLPGVIMQPSGVFATLCAQEAGCHYILAS